MRNPLPLFVVAAIAATALSPAVRAQAKPAEELKRFDFMVGTWKAEGHTHVMGQKVPWTADQSVRWVLDGHALQDDTIIELPEGRIAMRSMITWDSEAECLRMFTVDNILGVSWSDAWWTEDGKFVTFGTGVEEGQPFTERWVTTYSGEKEMSFESTRAVAAGEFAPYVVGTSEKVSDTPEEFDLEAIDHLYGAPQPKMENMGAMAGDYTMAGSGMGMDLAGWTKVRALFDGHVLEVRDGSNDESGYGSVHYISWNETDGCYRHFGVNSMGMSGHTEARYVGPDLVHTSAEVMGGVPFANRTVMSFGEDGSLVKVVSHMLMGTDAPMKDFEATYTRKDTADATNKKGSRKGDGGK